MDAGTRNLLLLAIILTSSTTVATQSISGIKATCSNEGEEVIVEEIKNCYKCMCQNGYIECDESETCPSVDDCYILVKKPAGGCCGKCRECVFNGQVYPSGHEWSDPGDPCSNYKCVAGVITQSNIKCYAPCGIDAHPVRPGQCCPTCLGACYVNGQYLEEGREVTLIDDPCVKCSCTDKRLTCMKKACPVLQCPISKQKTLLGQCCPICTEQRELMQIPVAKCMFATDFHSYGRSFDADHCSKCTCINGTSLCTRPSCPVLECSKLEQKLKPGECCPTCPPGDFKEVCSYEGKIYHNNDTWNISPCRSCECRSGVTRCAIAECKKEKCRPNETLVTLPNQCCGKCVESPGVCTVFGDPHYKTFDGKFFSFQGSCKYQLAADCQGHSFSIRVTNDVRSTIHSSWTKTVTLKMGNLKVNLGQKMRVKVNGTRVVLPHKLGQTLNIFKNDDQDLVIVKTKLGIKLSWDGYNFLQVQVPTSYKNKLCGLCGNYNNTARDDLTTRTGVQHTDDNVWQFANSWRVGGNKACARKKEKFPIEKCKRRRQPLAKCRPLDLQSSIFGNCNNILSPQYYFKACETDMCECPSGLCYCDSFAAYARECQRIGISLPDWRKSTRCPVNASSRRQLDMLQRTRKRIKAKRPRPKFYDHTPIIRASGNRTPPPLQ